MSRYFLRCTVVPSLGSCERVRETEELERVSTVLTNFQCTNPSPPKPPTSPRVNQAIYSWHGITEKRSFLILTWQGCPPDQQGVALMWSKPLHSGVVKHHDKLLKWVLADCIISVSGVVRSRTTPSSTNKKTRIHMLSHIVVAFWTFVGYIRTEGFICNQVIDVILMHFDDQSAVKVRVRSMRWDLCADSSESVRSMCWDLFSVIGGPCKRYAVTLTVGHACQATTASQGRTRLLKFYDALGSRVTTWSTQRSRTRRLPPGLQRCPETWKNFPCPNHMYLSMLGRFATVEMRCQEIFK